MPNANTETIVQFTRDPSLQAMELRYSEYSEPIFHRHNHDAYSIGLVKKGRTRFHLVQREEQVFPVSRGNVVLINQGEVHACNPDPGVTFAYYMLYLEPDFFLWLAADILRRPVTAYRFPGPVIKTPLTGARVNHLCRSIEAHHPRLEIESLLHELLAEITTREDITPDTPLRDPGPVETGYQYLREHPAENISLQELAAHCHLSPYHFLRSFRRAYGLPPHTAQQQMRIHLARKLLAEGESIASTAAATGFADQSHFTREFKKSMGATPQKYQRGVSA